MVKIIGVIPARYQSSRFPGKPIADICGKPLVWWVYKQAEKVSVFDNVYVATDDERIAASCEKLHIPVVMTSSKHKTGTDRVGEVSEKIKGDLYVNIQGDEPLIEPGMINSAIKPFLKKGADIFVTNLMAKIKDKSDLSNPTVPKVVFNVKKEAIFLSRLPIPYPKNSIRNEYYKQVCVYAFRKPSLKAFCAFPRGIIEMVEDIELLRFIENGISVQMVEVNGSTVAVDTPFDLERVRGILSKKTMGYRK